MEELSRHGRPEGERGPEKEDEDWILVNYLGEARMLTVRPENDDCSFKFRSKTHEFHQQSGGRRNRKRAHGSIFQVMV